MVKILFVCHGNICRSPMAEFVMKDMVQAAGLQDKIYVESAATSTEEIGNPVYPPARRKLAEHGISCAGKINLINIFCYGNMSKRKINIKREDDKF